MTILGRLIEWLRRREPKRDDAPRIVSKGERREREPQVDQIEELRRLIGEVGRHAPRPRVKSTSAPRVRSRRRSF